MYKSGKIHGNVRYDENDEKDGDYLVYYYSEIPLEKERL
jgi:antitoxin component YwqK of YwqJK toxin-antitoxin module